MNIFLIGFMGSGKSTIGKLLACELNSTFEDIDQTIEKQYNKTIGEIFATEGEEKFREIEHNIIRSGFVNDSGSVVSVGGGLPCFNENMALMNSKGITVYLKMSPEAIFTRITALPEKARATRPLIANKTDAELKQYITDTLNKRESFYNKAKLVISNEVSDASICVARILKAISYL